MSKVKVVVFSLLPLFILLFVLETSLRLYYLFEPQDVKVRAVPHSQLLYNLESNFEGWHLADSGWVFVKTNSHGFRTHEFTPKRPDLYRILILGDSFMFGTNASQDQTTAVVLERLLQDKISKDVEVLSLGIPSYSGIRYEMLGKIFFDELKPDMVIVAIDASDFTEDLRGINQYELDSNHRPIRIKSYHQMPPNHGVAIDLGRRTTFIPLPNKYVEFFTRSGIGRLVLNFHIKRMKKETDGIAERYLNGDDRLPKITITTGPPYPHIVDFGEPSNMSMILTYEQFISMGKQLKPTAIMTIAGRKVHVVLDLITYPFEEALKKYQTTFRSMTELVRMSQQRGIRLYFSSYPYPYYVSVKDSIQFQLFNMFSVFDFRTNRTQVRMMDNYTSKLGVPHLNAFPTFEDPTDRYWGSWDLHFNAKGYSRYAQFLFDSVSSDIIRDMAVSSGKVRGHPAVVGPVLVRD